MQCSSSEQIFDLCFMIHLPKDVGDGFPNITLLCWIFSQDVIYEINFHKKFSKFLMN